MHNSMRWGTMDYYYLSCRAGTEKLNIRILKKIIKTQFEEEKKFKAYFPLREITDQTPYGPVQKLLPMLEGYIVIGTEYNLTKYAYMLRRMSTSSRGLVHNLDRTFILHGADKAYAEWIFENNGIIKESEVIVHKTLKEGTKVQVLDGPMKNLQGRIIRIKKNTKCLVEIYFLGAARKVNLPIRIVQMIDDTSSDDTIPPAEDESNS